MFAELGAEVVDADALVHELLAPGGAAVEPVLAEFPACAAKEGHGVDRKALGALVFADPARRARLEAILHPLVLEETDRRAAAAAARGCEVFVTDAALILEAARGELGPSSLERYDAVVVVTCDPEVQAQRHAARHGGSTEEARRSLASRLAAQLSQEEKAGAADFVIDNSGTPARTREQVRVVHSRLAPRARSPAKRLV
jgi:dephospho-CoA kinase